MDRFKPAEESGNKANDQSQASAKKAETNPTIAGWNSINWQRKAKDDSMRLENNKNSWKYALERENLSSRVSWVDPPDAFSRPELPKSMKVLFSNADDINIRGMMDGMQKTLQSHSMKTRGEGTNLALNGLVYDRESHLLMLSYSSGHEKPSAAGSDSSASAPEGREVMRSWASVNNNMKKGENDASLRLENNKVGWKYLFGERLSSRIFWIDPPDTFTPNSGASKVNMLFANTDGNNMEALMDSVDKSLHSYSESNKTPSSEPYFRLEGAVYDSEKHAMMLSYSISSESRVSSLVPSKIDK